jgi:hypothetical protein
VGPITLSLKRIEHRRFKANPLNQILRKATIHHLFRAAESYVLTMTIDKLLLHSRREISNGRFTRKEGSQPEAKRELEGNMNRGNAAQTYGGCYSFYTADER